MGKSKSMNKKGKGKKAVSNPTAPPVSILEYRGPTRLPSQREQEMTTTVEFTVSATLASSVAGGINLVIGNAPNGGTDWTNVSAHFDEYRTLATTFRYEPQNIYSTAGAVNKTPILAVIDRDSSGNLTSYAGAFAFGSARVLSLERKWSIVMKASSIDELTYINTAAPANNAWIKFWSAGNTVSNNMGQYFITYLVQFRGQI